MCGDFNCQLNNTADKSVRYLQDLIRYGNMDDMWTKHYPCRLGYTWCDAKNDPKSRIDYVFINNSFCYTLDDIIIRKIPGTHSNGSRMTDHRYLKFIFAIDKTKRGPGYWKLNVTYLENEKYRKGIIDIIENIDSSLSPIKTWELIKRKFKEFSIEFAKCKQQSVKEKIKLIESEIDEIEISV